MIFLHTISPTLGVCKSAQRERNNNEINALPFMAWKSLSLLSSLPFSSSSLLPYSTKGQSSFPLLSSLYCSLRNMVLSACWIPDCCSYYLNYVTIFIHCNKGWFWMTHLSRICISHEKRLKWWGSLNIMSCVVPWHVPCIRAEDNCRSVKASLYCVSR